jgi:hypothetical protein
VGAVYRSTIQVRDDTGALTNPATKIYTVTQPDGSTATPTIVSDGTGLFHADFMGAQEGLHSVSWVTTGPDTARTDYENFIVFRSVVGIGEVRDFLHLNDTSQDDMLRVFMAGATELAESIVGTCVVRTITNEHIPGGMRAAIRLPQGPLPDASAVTSITSVWPNGPTWDSTLLNVYPESGVVEPKDMQGFWFGPWVATYKAGRKIIPLAVVLAVKEIVFDLWATQRMPQADQLEPGLEETSTYEATMPPGYDMPPHAKALLAGVGGMPGFA